MVLKLGRKSIPPGIMIIAGVYGLSAILSFLIGILALISASFVGEVEILGEFAGALGAVLVVLGMLQFFIARGLLYASFFARFLAVISAVLGVLATAFLVIKEISFEGIIGLLATLWACWYLVSCQNSKTFFKTAGK